MGSQKAEKRQVIWTLAFSEACVCNMASSLDVHLPVTPQGHDSVCGLGHSYNNLIFTLNVDWGTSLQYISLEDAFHTQTVNTQKGTSYQAHTS